MNSRVGQAACSFQVDAESLDGLEGQPATPSHTNEHTTAPTTHLAPAARRPHPSTPPTHQPKIADAQIAVGVEQQVGGLQVAVHHPRRVHILKAPQQLVHYGLHHLLCSMAVAVAVAGAGQGGTGG